MNKRLHLFLLPLCVFILSFTASMIAWNSIHTQQQKFLEDRVQAEATLIQSEIVNLLHTRITSIQHMASRWESYGRTSKDLWEKEARLYMELPGYQAIEWVDKTYRVQWVIPLKGNKKALGLDLRFEPKRAAALKKAQEQKEIMYSGIVDLVQGKKGMLVFFPLYVEGEFDGFMLAVFDIPALLDAVLTEDIIQGYQLWIDEGGDEFYSLHADDEPHKKWELTSSIKFHDLEWTLRTSPASSWVEPQELLSRITFISGVFLSTLLAFVAYFVRVSYLRSQTVIENEKLMAAIIENTVDGLITIDHKGTIQTINRACITIFGYKHHEIIGKSVKFLMPEPYQNEYDEYFKNHKIGRKKKIFGISREVEGKRKDGTIFPLELSVSKISIKNKKIYSGIVRDITERKNAEDELLRSNTELERFAYVASHDLQEPLRMVTNFTGLLEKRYGDHLDSTAKEYLDFAYNGARRMQDLVNDLLDYARIGQESENYKDVEVEKLMQVVRENLKESIQENGASLTYQNLPTVHTNPVRLMRVLQNLVGNSLKYKSTDKKTVIQVSSRKDNNMWHFIVKDNGIGMKPEYCQKIFEPFKRLHAKHEYTGTGMGLSICRKIVEGFGGKIWAESTPGEGSMFHLTIPANDTNQIQKEYA